ncbi:hypothetical protein [Calidifontibacter indicus]|uniref:hypothetical protein n=1 Tax=Calidifontibacter indicus TaxID=419650 RepID=UPI0011C06E2A|nr:hypothetical protein [Calidifontibacter indicus]
MNRTIPPGQIRPGQRFDFLEGVFVLVEHFFAVLGQDPLGQFPHCFRAGAGTQREEPAVDFVPARFRQHGFDLVDGVQAGFPDRGVDLPGGDRVGQCLVQRGAGCFSQLRDPGRVRRFQTRPPRLCFVGGHVANPVAGPVVGLVTGVVPRIRRAFIGGGFVQWHQRTCHGQGLGTEQRVRTLAGGQSAHPLGRVRSGGAVHDPAVDRVAGHRDESGLGLLLHKRQGPCERGEFGVGQVAGQLRQSGHGSHRVGHQSGTSSGFTRIRVVQRLITLLVDVLIDTFVTRHVRIHPLPSLMGLEARPLVAGPGMTDHPCRLHDPGGVVTGCWWRWWTADRDRAARTPG